MKFKTNLTQEQTRTLIEKLNEFLNEEIYNDDIVEEVEDELDIYRLFAEYLIDTIREG